MNWKLKVVLVTAKYSFEKVGSAVELKNGGESLSMQKKINGTRKLQLQDEKNNWIGISITIKQVWNSSWFEFVLKQNWRLSLSLLIMEGVGNPLLYFYPTC